MTSPTAMPLVLALCLCAMPGGGWAQDDHAEGDHAGEDHAGAGAEDDAHVSKIGDVRLLHAWTRATEDATADVFVEIENQGSEAVRLTGGSADLAERITLVATSTRAGDLTSETIEAIPIRPDVTLTLEPGGLYLNLTGLDRDLTEGDSFPMTLVLEPAGEVEINVDVEAADATRHSHAGHAH